MVVMKSDVISKQYEDRSEPVQAASRVPTVEATELFRGSDILHIDFRGERYQLRQTRNGKLILTK